MQAAARRPDRGAVAWLSAGLGAWHTHQLEQHALRTQGSVDWDDVGGSAHAWVSFALPSGEEVAFMASGPTPYMRGQRAPVLYLAEDPAGSACLDASGQLWMPHLLKFMFGFAFLTIGLWIVLNRPLR